MLRIGFFILVLSCFNIHVNGQGCTNPGQLPVSSFPVCGATVFSQAVVPVCSGSPIPTKCITPGVVYADKNPYWYKFSCYATGTLGFVITPNNLGDDYDWQLFNITGHQPSDVYTDTSLFVSCNWSGDTGTTGASSSGISSINCAGVGVPTFNEMPMLYAGNTYLLMVSHFDNVSQSGYSLEFTGGTAGITDTTTSRIFKAISSCGGDTIQVVLNKKMKCSSLASNGSDFTLSATGTQIVKAIGVNCNNVFDMDTVLLVLNNSLAAGNYSLTCKIGSDSNTLLDYCDVQMVPGIGVNFSVNPVPPAKIDSILPLNCRPNAITIMLKGAVRCSSVDPNGSDFKITGPSQVVVDSAIFQCIGDTVSKITLLLTSPILVGGQYNLMVQKGADSNTLSNTCNVFTPPGTNKRFIVADTVDAQFSFTLSRSCKGDTVRFFPNNNGGINSWNWVIDTFMTTIKNPVRVFTNSGNFTVQLIVSNGVCKDTVVRSIVITAIPSLAVTLSVKDVTCFNAKNGILTANASGGVGSYSYQWLHTNSTYYGNPFINADTGKYVLTVTDSIGCKVNAIGYIKQPAELKHIQYSTKTTCGLRNGKAGVTVTGGLPPYQYNWLTRLDTTPSINGLAAGNYILKIIDKNGCADTAQFFIAPSIGVQLSVLSKTNSCIDSSTGSAILTASGNGSIQYQWFPAGGFNYFANDLSYGNYTVVATDSVGCIDTLNFRIGTNPAISVQVQQGNITCYNYKNGFIRLSSPGNMPYTYYWPSLGSASPNVTGLDIGTYQVVIKDTFGCKLNRQFIIKQPRPLQLDIKRKNTTCGLNNGSIEAIVQGGTTPYFYTWSNGYTQPKIVNLPPLKVDVAVRDSNGCTINHYGVNVAPSRPISVSLGNDVDLCPGDTFRLRPGIFNSYQWQDGSTLPTYLVKQGGIYRVTVQNDSGCTASASVKVNAVCNDLLFPDAFTPNNDMRNDAFGPIGTLQSIKQYSLKVFDRLGKLFFVTNNPFQKWDGKVNGVNVANGTYVWVAEYAITGKSKQIKKGSIVLMR